MSVEVGGLLLQRSSRLPACMGWARGPDRAAPIHEAGAGVSLAG